MKINIVLLNLLIIFSYVENVRPEGSCHLDSDPSVKYFCPGLGPDDAPRRCGPLEPEGTVVTAECNVPYYSSPYPFPPMRCTNGTWDYVATCTPECGITTPGEHLTTGPGGVGPAARGKHPWYAAIYRKTRNPYTQICAGSLVTTTVVISAAHCFWSNEGHQQPAADYAVAVDKVYRAWDDARDVDAQKSDVRSIHLPKRFLGDLTNYQDDIAVVELAHAFVYKPNVRPVCLDFHIDFERRQLQTGRFGEVAGWRPTEGTGAESPALAVVEFPYVDIEQCYQRIPADFKEYITSDKICAGENNNRTVACKGNTGGGLVFPEPDRGVNRYYLRGVMSTAPNNGAMCNTDALTSFTQVLRHEGFIKSYL